MRPLPSRSTRTPFILVALALLLAACGEDEATSDGGESTEGGTDTEASGVEDEPEATLQFAHIYEPDHPHHRCGAEELSRIIEEQPELNMTIGVFPASQLGDLIENVEQLQTGQLDLANPAAIFVAAHYPAMNVLDAAFAFSDVDHATRVVTGELGQSLEEGLVEETNMRVLGWWFHGARQLTADKPIRHPDDFAGVTLRVPGAPLFQNNASAMGASPTSMAFDEVYLGLQQGAIDAQENPVPTIETMGFHEVQDYLILTSHMIQTFPVVVNEDSWTSLSSRQQEALEEAVKSLEDPVKECVLDDEREILDGWRESGEIEILEDIDREAFESKAAEHLTQQYPEWADQYREIRDTAAE